MKYKILGTFVSIPQNLNNKIVTAIRKSPVDKLIIKKESLQGDQVANTRYHGGDMRVIHHYSQKNYNYLKEKFPDISDRFSPGTFGENLFTEELTESELNIGDIYSLGSAKIQLTVSRRPCVTINYSYNDDRVFKEVLKTGRTGWFYRVLEEGEVSPGDYLEFLDRPFPDLSVQRLYDQGYAENRFSDQAFIKRCVDSGLMDKGWGVAISNHFNPQT